MNFKKLLILFLVALMPVLLTVGCDDSSNPNVSGYYEATNTSFVDAFEVDNAEALFYKYDDTEKTVSFAGDVAGNPDFSQDALIFAVEITESGSWNKTVGKFIAVSIKENDGSFCLMSTAYSTAEGAKNECDTAEEALATQTIAEGYFAFYGEYQRQ